MKQIKNFTEVIVAQYLREHLAELGVCQCEDCRQDIMAIMLNKLPPHYIVTDAGAIYAQLKQFDPQHTVDVAIAMAEAVAAVKKNPKHE